MKPASTWSGSTVPPVASTQGSADVLADVVLVRRGGARHRLHVRVAADGHRGGDRERPAAAGVNVPVYRPLSGLAAVIVTGVPFTVHANVRQTRRRGAVGAEHADRERLADVDAEAVERCHDLDLGRVRARHGVVQVQPPARDGDPVHRGLGIDGSHEQRLEPVRRRGREVRLEQSRGPRDVRRRHRGSVEERVPSSGNRRGCSSPARRGPRSSVRSSRRRTSRRCGRLMRWPR